MSALGGPYASGPPSLRQRPPEAESSVALSERRKHGQRDGTTCCGPSLTQVCGRNCPSVGVCGSHGLRLWGARGVRGGGRQRRVRCPWGPFSTPLEEDPRPCVSGSPREQACGPRDPAELPCLPARPPPSAPPGRHSLPSRGLFWPQPRSRRGLGAGQGRGKGEGPV